MMRATAAAIRTAFSILVGWLLAGSVSAATPINVVLMAGQSNMEGWAYSQFLPNELQQPQADVQYYNGNPKVGAATLQTLRPLPLSAGGDVTFGPEITFGRAWKDSHPTQQLALIKTAFGGTSLATDWHATAPVGGKLTQFKASVDAGLQSLVAAGYTPNVIGMLWLQGENDASDSAMAGAYQQNLTDLISNVRAQYGANLPFVIGGIGYVSGPHRAIVLTASANVAGAVPNVRYFSNDDINTTNQLHLDTAMMRTVGERFASNLASVPEPSSATLVGVAACALLRRRRCESATSPRAA